MQNETTENQVEAQNTEAAASESPEQELGNGASASTASVSEGNGTTAGETLVAPAQPASIAVGEGNEVAPAHADAASESSSATDAPAAGEIAQADGAGQAGAINLEGAGAAGLAASLVNESEIVPTTGGSVPTDPLLLATVSVFRSRFDGQFFIQANTGEGYSAPNASTAGHVAANLVATIVQESINGKFEYAAGAA